MFFRSPSACLNHFFLIEFPFIFPFFPPFLPPPIYTLADSRRERLPARIGRSL